VKLLLDFNLSPKLVAMLSDIFPESGHVFTLGLLGETPDPAIWEYAKQHGYSVLSADSDFVELANRLGPPPKLVYLAKMAYLTREAAELIRRNAVRIAEFNKSDDALLILRR
jgi:predicted nuclease of predicted toxin-antitoxin system